MTANALKGVLLHEHAPHKEERKEAHGWLRSPGWLAQWPMIGLGLFLFGSLMFGGLALNLRAHGPLLAWDKALSVALPALALKSPAFVRPLMAAGFYLGKEVVMVLDILLGLTLLFKRYWQELAMLAVGAGGAGLLFTTLSNLFGRVRPPTQIWILVHIPGFPSGHSLSVVVCYGLLAYLLVPKMPSAFWKIVVAAAAVLIMGFVGFSRVFTGGHYLTDVLAGYAVGIAWAGAAYTLVEMFFQRRRSSHVKEE